MNWVSCKQCQKQNSLDGLFCRRCGHALDEQELQTAKTENETLLSEGFKFLSDHRYDEAYETAKVVLEVDPSLVQAYSLMGDVLERKKDYNGALIAFERVLQENPSSTLDQIKLNHVRSLMQAQISVPVKTRPSKGRAAAIALVTTLMVACIGAAVIVMTDANKKVSLPENLVANNSQNNGGYSTYGGEKINMNDVIRPDANNIIVAPGAKVDTNGTGANPETTTTSRNTNTAERSNSQNDRNEARPGSVRGELPSTSGNSSGLRPMGVVNPDVSRSQPEPGSRPVGPNQPNAQDPDPTAAGTPTNNSANSNTNGTQNPKPVIDIRPSPGNRTNSNGGGTQVPNNEANSVKNTLAEAKRQYIMGNYSDAAKLFEEALNKGAEAGMTNQRLAQCYDKLGKKSEARRCYEKAVEVFERRIAGGDTSSSTKAGLDSARQALKAL